MSLPWQNVTQQIVMSVEAPDFDTYVASALTTNTTNARRSRWTGAYRQIYFSVLGVFALFGLLTVWWISSSMGWFFFWMGFVMVLGSLVFQYFLTVRRVTRRNSTWDSAAAVIVRDAAIAGDSKNAPLAQFQPTLPASAPATPEPTTITELYRPITLIVPGTTSAGLMAMQTIALVVIIGTLVALVIVNNSLNLMNGLISLLPQYLALYFMAIVASLGALIQKQRLRLPFSVAIHAQGVTWRQGRKRRAEPWSAAQAACRALVGGAGGVPSLGRRRRRSVQSTCSPWAAHFSHSASTGCNSPTARSLGLPRRSQYGRVRKANPTPHHPPMMRPGACAPSPRSIRSCHSAT